MAAERIGIVGAGLMGHGIAQVFACAGHAVAITDSDAEALASVPERIAANLRAIGEDPAPPGSIELAPSIEAAVAGADVVFEAAYEDLELKRALFARMSRAAGPDTLLASNTSVISVTEIAAEAHDPARVVGTHWWNPPYLVPLVEVVQAERTSGETVERMIGLLRRTGKLPVHVRRDVPGFVGNRLQHALWHEAMSLVEAGVCDAETVDLVVKNSFGLRMPALGPLEGADLVGLDLALAIHEYLIPRLDRSPAPAPILREKVERGELGMKTGRGFREWTPEAARQTRERLLRHLVSVTGGGRRDNEAQPA